MYRTIKHERKYILQRNNVSSCPFCFPKAKEIIKEGKYFRIFKNIFGYDIWDRHQVTKHLMLIPKKHLVTLKNLSKPAQMEYFKFYNEYLKKGFNIFTRPNSSQTKTKTHFHTHLIQTSDKLYQEISFVADPYYLKIK